MLSAAAVARSEEGLLSADDSVNRAFDGLGATRDFYKQVLDRNSIDGRGMPLGGYVHRGVTTTTRSGTEMGWCSVMATSDFSPTLPSPLT